MKIKTYVASPSLTGVGSVVVLVCWFIVGAAIFLFCALYWQDQVFGMIEWFCFCLAGLLHGIALVEMPTRITFWLIRQWHHDGVELLLTSAVLEKLRENPDYYDRLAKRYGLDLRFHQPWCIPDLFQRVLVLLGVTPPISQIASAINEGFHLGINQMVIHSDFISVVKEEYRSRCLVEIVDDSPIPEECKIVLDTCYSVAKGRELLPVHLNDYTMIWTARLLEFQNRIGEFHIYDVLLKTLKLMRKNRWPGSGSLPLVEILKKVCSSIEGEATLVLELNPIQLIWKVLTSLGRFQPTKERFLRQVDQ